MREKELEKVFRAFGNKRRLAIVLYLRNVKESNVGDIASHIKLSFRATSKHLAVLRNAGVLENEQRGVLMFYSILKDKSEIVSKVLPII